MSRTNSIAGAAGWAAGFCARSVVHVSAAMHPVNAMAGRARLRMLRPGYRRRVLQETCGVTLHAMNLTTTILAALLAAGLQSAPAAPPRLSVKPTQDFEVTGKG